MTNQEMICVSINGERGRFLQAGRASSLLSFNIFWKNTSSRIVNSDFGVFADILQPYVLYHSYQHQEVAHMVRRTAYLQRLASWKDEQVIKVNTGIRRCGKSTLLKQYQELLREQGVGGGTDHLHQL